MKKNINHLKDYFQDLKNQDDSGQIETRFRHTYKKLRFIWIYKGSSLVLKNGNPVNFKMDKR